MKKFIGTAVAFMLMLMFFGCFATMTPEERKETYDLRSSVGNSSFVGSTRPQPGTLRYHEMFGY